MFFKEPEEEYAVKEPISGGMAAALAVSAIATLVIGIVPSWLWDAVASAFARSSTDGVEAVSPGRRSGGR